jgi:hypothetical protein
VPVLVNYNIASVHSYRRLMVVTTVYLLVVVSNFREYLHYSFYKSLCSMIKFFIQVLWYLNV